MVENKQDAFARAYATLTSLRKNINEMKCGVLETYVREFHNVLDKLERIGIDVSDFRIPTSEVKPKVISASPVSNVSGRATGQATYSKEKYVDKSYILTKIDALLGYFEITTSEKPRSIGFSKPEK